MTEDLRGLIRDAAGEIDVPAPPVSDIRVRGRRLRRSRRAARGLAGVVAALAVAAGAVWALTGDDATTRAVDPAAPATSQTGAVFAVGATVYTDDGRRASRINDTAVKSLYYTSAGVLVRHGLNGNSDGGGPQRFSLVRPDGTVSGVDVVTQETWHATDPEQPYVAYAQVVEDTVHVLVHDVDRDEQVADVAVPEADTAFSPVSIDGDTVFLSGSFGEDFLIDWRTGEVTPGAVDATPEVDGGRSSTTVDGRPSVVDSRTGQLLLQAPTEPDGGGYFALSPDGGHAVLASQGRRRPPTFEVYDVATGASVDIPGAAYEYGWTIDGQLFTVAAGTLTTCSPHTGECTDTALDVRVPPGGNERAADVRLGGLTYES